MLPLRQNPFGPQDVALYEHFATAARWQPARTPARARVQLQGVVPDGDLLRSPLSKTRCAAWLWVTANWQGEAWRVQQRQASGPALTIRTADGDVRLDLEHARWFPPADSIKAVNADYELVVLGRTTVRCLGKFRPGRADLETDNQGPTMYGTATIPLLIELMVSQLAPARAHRVPPRTG